MSISLIKGLAPLRGSAHVRLVPSPATEALAVVISLQQALLRSDLPGTTRDESHTIPLKLALFNLQKHVKEEEFSVEFMLRGGVHDLVSLLQDSDGGLSGNSLAVSEGSTLLQDYRRSNGSTLCKA